MKRLSFIFALAIAAFLSSQTVAEAQILKNLFKQATSSTTTESATTAATNAATSAAAKVVDSETISAISSILSLLK